MASKWKWKEVYIKEDIKKLLDRKTYSEKSKRTWGKEISIRRRENVCRKKMNWMPRKPTNGMFKIIWITCSKTRKKPLVAMKDKEECLAKRIGKRRDK